MNRGAQVPISEWPVRTKPLTIFSFDTLAVSAANIGKNKSAIGAIPTAATIKAAFSLNLKCRANT
jgi:hypothetical protein